MSRPPLGLSCYALRLYASGSCCVMQWMLPPPKTTCSVVFAFALMVVVALGLRAYSRTIVPEEPTEEELAAARPAPDLAWDDGNR